MTIKISLQDRGGAQRCVYCRDELDGVCWTCAGCGSSLHDECADDLSMCPTAGCSRPTGRRTRSQGAPPGEPERGSRPWGALAFVLYLMAVGAGGALETCSHAPAPAPPSAPARPAPRAQALPADLGGLRDLARDRRQAYVRRRAALDELQRRALAAGREELEPLLALAEVALGRPLRAIEQIAEQRLHQIVQQRDQGSLSYFLLALAGEQPEQIANWTLRELEPLHVAGLIRLLDPRHDYGRRLREVALRRLVEQPGAIPLRLRQPLARALAERLVPTQGPGDDSLLAGVEGLGLEDEVVRALSELHADGQRSLKFRLIHVLRHFGCGEAKLEASIALARLAREAESAAERAQAAQALEEVQAAKR